MSEKQTPMEVLKATRPWWIVPIVVLFAFQMEPFWERRVSIFGAKMTAVPQAAMIIVGAHADYANSHNPKK